jgi:hypothetical protein
MHRKIPDGYGDEVGLFPDSVGRQGRLQTKIPLDFILQMNGMT